jgi:hypothetical protein
MSCQGDTRHEDHESRVADRAAQAKRPTLTNPNPKLTVDATFPGWQGEALSFSGNRERSDTSANAVRKTMATTEKAFPSYETSVY